MRHVKLGLIFYGGRRLNALATAGRIPLRSFTGREPLDGEVEAFHRYVEAHIEG